MLKATLWRLTSVHPTRDDRRPICCQMAPGCYQVQAAWIKDNPTEPPLLVRALGWGSRAVADCSARAGLLLWERPIGPLFSTKGDGRTKGAFPLALWRAIQSRMQAGYDWSVPCCPSCTGAKWWLHNRSDKQGHGSNASGEENSAFQFISTKEFCRNNHK